MLPQNTSQTNRHSEKRSQDKTQDKKCTIVHRRKNTRRQNAIQTKCTLLFLYFSRFLKFEFCRILIFHLFDIEKFLNFKYLKIIRLKVKNIVGPILTRIDQDDSFYSLNFIQKSRIISILFLLLGILLGLLLFCSFVAQIRKDDKRNKVQFVFDCLLC